MAKSFKFISEASKRAYLKLPKAIQKQFGSDLNAIQQGKSPFSESKDISDSVGKGAIELIENGSPAYRCVYCVKYLDTVYILHSFTKTCEGVDRAAMSTAEGRYKDMMAEVKELKQQAKKKEKGKKKKPQKKKKPRKSKK